MYDLAAKIYPYSNVSGERVDDDNLQRQNNVKFQSESPEALLTQGSGMSFLFVYMMSRGGAKSLFDMSQVFNKPARALGWFLLGNSVLMFWKINYLAKTRQNDSARYALNLRVTQNEQAHAILKTMKFHLGTRKMDVFEINSR